MKLKNVSDKVKMFKVKGKWVNVQPGELVELSGIVESEEGLEEVVEEGKEVPEVKEPKEEVKKVPKKKAKKEVVPKSKEELNKMTKDQLNDYAAKNGLDKVSSRMRKADMVKAILKHQKK